MNITVKITDTILPFASEWDEFLPPLHHLQSHHLLAFENAKIDAVQTNYVLVFLRNKLIGLLYFQKFQFQHKHLNFNGTKQFLSAFLKFILPHQLPLLVCGSLFRINFQGFYFKNPGHTTLVFDAIELFIQESKNYKPVGIIIKDCNEAFIEQNIKQCGYRFFNGDVTMELHRRIHWKHFDDYLKDLNKKYLQRAKKIIRSFETIEIKELNAEEVLHHAAEINQLYWNVVNKQTIKLGDVNAAYFYELKKDLQQNFEFYALYKHEILVGFYTFIFYESEMETHFIGMDYEANKNHQLYFNILFLSTQKMIERQYNKLELGRTARKAKVNLGAIPRQIFNYISITNPIAKLTLNYFLKRFNQSENQDLVNRTPLKDK